MSSLLFIFCSAYSKKQKPEEQEFYCEYINIDNSYLLEQHFLFHEVSDITHIPHCVSGCSAADPGAIDPASPSATSTAGEQCFVPDVVLFASSPFYVPAGYSVNVSLTALNTGRSAVENVVVDIAQTNSSVLVDGSTQRALGSLKPGEEKEIRYVLYSSYETSPGTYYVPVKVSYLRHNRPFSYATGMGVSVFSPQPVFSIEISDKPLEVGVGGNISVKITNAGKYPAYNAYAILRREQQGSQENATASDVTQLLGGTVTPSTGGSADGAMVVGNARVFLGDIEPGEQRNVSYAIVPDADLESGTYSYELQISFYPQSANQSISFSYPFGALFIGKPSIYLSSIEISQSVGGITISGDANNVGSEKVKSVILEATENDYFAPAYSGSTYYVGTMEPDDFIPFELKVMNKEPNMEPEEYNIRIRYLDSRNNEQVELFTLTMPPQPPAVESSRSFPYLYLLLPAIVLIVVIVFIFLRRRNR